MKDTLVQQCLDILKREDIKKQRFTNWKKNDERVKRGKGGEREQTESQTD